MAGIFPNPTADAQAFKVGQQVKWYVNSNEISPYIGRVSEICPGINKVWVEWPVGGNTQMDPTDLIIVPLFQGVSPIMEESGYSSYDKQRSQEQYGVMGPNVHKLARKMVANQIAAEEKQASEKVMAARIAKNFATDVVDKLAGAVLDCVEKGMSDVQAYQHIYPNFEAICSDGFLREAVEKVYQQRFAVTKKTDG